MKSMLNIHLHIEGFALDDSFHCQHIEAHDALFDLAITTMIGATPTELLAFLYYFFEYLTLNALFSTLDPRTFLPCQNN